MDTEYEIGLLSLLLFLRGFMAVFLFQMCYEQ